MPPGTDPDDWLHRYTAEEWLNAAMNELRATVDAVGRHDLRAGATGARRAAGMALNGALVVRANPSWGRTYVEHLQALAADDTAPRAATEAASELLEAQAQAGVIVTLQSPQAARNLLEAARTVMAHAYALVHGNQGKQGAT